MSVTGGANGALVTLSGPRARIGKILAMIMLASFGACSNTSAPVTASEDVPVLRARNGVLAFDLYAVTRSDGAPAFQYDGRVGVAPTLRVRPGDRIEIALHDELRAIPGHPADVNLHFHGLTVSPHAPSDDVITMVARAGQTLHYVVPIPRDHEPGLYWYHPHIHGQTFWEVAHGMSGAIVIEGIERRIPALAQMPEQLVILRQQPIGADINEAPNAPDNPEALEDADGNPCRPEIALRPTLNGQPRGDFHFTPGQQQFFRVLNASASRYFDLSIDGAKLDLVELDGVPLDAYAGARAVERVDHVVIAPAGRAEFVVNGPAQSGLLRSRCVDSGPSGDAQPATVLADVTVDPQANAQVPVALIAQAPSHRNVLELPPPPPARRRTIRLTEDANNFYIDGKTFDMKSMMGPAAYTAHAGTVEEWTVVNDTDEAHDFHLHQVHFAAEMIDGKPVASRHWVDTLNVPSRHHFWDHTLPGSVRLLVDFRNPIIRGAFMFHCHILDHEDRGMMAKMQVI